jgi:hypothetical protein
VWLVSAVDILFQILTDSFVQRVFTGFAMRPAIDGFSGEQEFSN